MQYDSFNRLRLYCEAEGYKGWDSFLQMIFHYLKYGLTRLVQI